MKFSVIIPTWRRVAVLENVLNSLMTQSIKNVKFEILVIDSNSNDGTSELINKYIVDKKIENLKIIQSDENTVSKKRNLGINEASGEYLIFIDDDCVPSENFLRKYLNLIRENYYQKSIICGGVMFENELVRNSNYYRYRDGCHFKEESKPRKLKFNQIVTMNMMISKKILKDYNLFFDTRFVGYGSEDIEYGLRASMLGINIISGGPNIIHLEPNGDIEKFSKKLFHSERDGMRIFNFITSDLDIKLGSLFLLEPVEKKDNYQTKIKKKIIHLILDSNLPRFLLKLLLRFDNIYIPKSNLLYRIALGGSARAGVKARSDVTLTIQTANKHGWYQ